MKQAHVLVVGGLDHTLDKLDQLGIRYSMMQTLARVNERQYRAATRYAVMDYEDMEEVLLLARAWHARGRSTRWCPSPNTACTRPRNARSISASRATTWKRCCIPATKSICANCSAAMA